MALDYGKNYYDTTTGTTYSLVHFGANVGKVVAIGITANGESTAALFGRKELESDRFIKTKE